MDDRKADEAEAISTGTTMGMAMFNRMASSAKMAPATGALNTAEMPPAAPQASSRMRVSRSRASRRATLLPMAAPVDAMGASSPADPPAPMVKMLVSTWE
ncbi:MAG: hypothetical protein QM724_08175 [Flavobacteriales bacterium]